MKYILYIATALLLITNKKVLAQQMDKVDTVILHCMHDHYAHHGIELDAALDSIEQQLIDQGIIESTSPSEIKAYYTNLSKGGKVKRISYTPIMDSVIKHHHLFSVTLKHCIYNNPEIDDSTFANSRYQTRQVRLTNAASKLEGEVYEKLATAILLVSDKETFSLPLFRAHFLLSIITVYEDKSYLRSTK